MTEKEKEKEIPWKPIIIGGLVLGGIYLISKLIAQWTGGTPEERYEKAMVIYEDYKVELEEMKDWVEQTNAGGRTPTDSETKVLDAMMDAMKLKEILIKTLSESVFSQLTDFIKTVAQNWWLVPLVIISPIAGYMTFKLVKGWFDHRKPPPSGGFTCPVCNEILSTASGLKSHIKNTHTPTTAHLTQAQAESQKLGSWTYGAIAVDTALYSQFARSWRTLSLSSLSDIAVSSANLYGLGAAGAYEMTLLRLIPYLLLV